MYVDCHIDFKDVGMMCLVYRKLCNPMEMSDVITNTNLSANSSLKGPAL